MQPAADTTNGQKDNLFRMENVTAICKLAILAFALGHRTLQPSQKGPGALRTAEAKLWVCKNA